MDHVASSDGTPVKRPRDEAAPTVPMAPRKKKVPSKDEDAADKHAAEADDDGKPCAEDDAAAEEASQPESIADPYENRAGFWV